MNIAANIKYLRKAFNLSQKDLGLIADVTDKAVWAWEQGIREPRMGALQRLADHFGIKKSDLIDGVLEEIFKNKNCSPNITVASRKSDFFTDAEIELIKKYRQLDADGRRSIERQIEFELYRIEKAKNSPEEKEGALG